jgi:hypothetical protein
VIETRDFCCGSHADTAQGLGEQNCTAIYAVLCALGVFPERLQRQSKGEPTTLRADVREFRL